MGKASISNGSQKRTHAGSAWPLLFLSLFFMPLLYVIANECIERYRLGEAGVETNGTVIFHGFGKPCRSHVEVEYLVQNVKHIARGVSPDCSYRVGNTLKGHTVTVNYVRDAPQISEVVDSKLRIESNRFNWDSLILIGWLPFGFWWAAYDDWKKKRKRAAV